MIWTNGMGFIGPENFSDASLTKNREMGVRLTNPEDLERLRESFADDWSHGKTRWYNGQRTSGGV